MRPDSSSISAALFERAAGNDLNVWRLLSGCQIVHVRFGLGTIAAVDKKKDVLFSVRFDQPYEGKLERQFSSLGFGKFFTELYLPEEKFDQVQKALLAPRKPEEPKQSKRKFQVDERQLKVIPRRTVLTVKPGIYRKDVGQKHKPKRSPGNVTQKCPYCFFTDRIEELAAHIRMNHPNDYPEWAEENGLLTKRTSDEERTDSEEVSYQVMSRCPLCDCLLKEKNYPKHLKKAHHGVKAEDHPLPPGSLVAVKQTVGKKKPSRRPRSKLGTPSKKLSPMAMKVLNVGRKSKHYTRRW